MDKLKVRLKSADTKDVLWALTEIRNQHKIGSSRIDLVEDLVPLLDRPNTKVIDHSLSVVANMLMDSKVRSKFRTLGGIDKLVKIINNLEDLSLLRRGFRAVSNAALDPKTCRTLHQLGLASILGKRLKCAQDEQMLIILVRCVRVVSDAHQYRAWLHEEGIYETLGTLMQDKSAEDPTTLESTEPTIKPRMELMSTLLKTLAKLTHGATLDQAEKVMVATGAIVKYCDNLEREVWEHSLMTLVNLSQHSTLRPSLGNAGVVRCLVNRFDDDLCTDKETGHMVTALCLYCRESVNRVKLRELGGCRVLIQVLDSDRLVHLHDRVINSLLQFMYDNHSLNVLMSAGLIPSLVKFLETYINTRSASVEETPSCHHHHGSSKRTRSDTGDVKSEDEKTDVKTDGATDNDHQHSSNSTHDDSGGEPPTTPPQADNEVAASSHRTPPPEDRPQDGKPPSKSSGPVFRINSPSYQAVQYELEQFLQMRAEHQGSAATERSPARLASSSNNVTDPVAMYSPASPSSLLQSPDRSPLSLTCGYSPERSLQSWDDSNGSGPTSPKVVISDPQSPSPSPVSPLFVSPPTGGGTAMLDYSPPSSPPYSPPDAQYSPISVRPLSPPVITAGPSPFRILHKFTEEETYSDEEEVAEEEDQRDEEKADVRQQNCEKQKPSNATSHNPATFIKDDNNTVEKAADSAGANSSSQQLLEREESSTTPLPKIGAVGSSETTSVVDGMTSLSPPAKRTKLAIPGVCAGPATYKYSASPVASPLVQKPTLSQDLKVVENREDAAIVGEKDKKKSDEWQRLDWILQIISRLTQADRPHEDLTSSRTIQCLFSLMSLDPDSLGRISRIFTRLSKNLYCLMPFLLQRHACWISRQLEQSKAVTADYCCELCADQQDEVRKVSHQLLHNLTLLAETGYGEGEICHRLVTPTFSIADKQCIAISSAMLVKQRRKLYNILINHDSLEILLDLIEQSTDESLLLDTVLSLSTVSAHIGVVSPQLTLPPEQNTECLRADLCESTYDLSLVLDDGSEIGASRALLSSSSSVFAAMLEGGFVEASKTRIMMPLTSNCALQCIIHHLYGCSWCPVFQSLSAPDLLELLSLSDKFLLQELNIRISHQIIRGCLRGTFLEQVYRSSLQKEYTVRCAESSLSGCTISAVLVAEMDTPSRHKLIHSLVLSELRPDFLDDVNRMIRKNLTKQL